MLIPPIPMKTCYTNLSHLWVTYPFPHKSACVSPSFQLGRFVPQISFSSQDGGRNPPAEFLCSVFCYFESTKSSSPFLLLTAAWAANMTALINNQLEWERPVSTESHRCMLSPSPGEYKQRRINSLEEHSLPVVPLMWDFNLTPPLFSSSSSLHFPSLSTKQLQDWKEKDSDIAFVRTFSLSSCRCNMFRFSYIIQGFVFNPLTERRASLS